MKIETAKQIAYCIPVVQQVLGAVNIITGLARLIFDAIRPALSKEVKLQNIKADLRLMAKGVLLLSPIISTIFFLVVLLKKPQQDEEELQAKSILFNEKKEDLFSEETKEELKTLFDAKGNATVMESEIGYTKGKSSIEIVNAYGNLLIELDQELLEKDPLFILDALSMSKDFNESGDSFSVSFNSKSASGRGVFKHFLTTLLQSAVPLLLDEKTKMPLTQTDGVNNAKRLRVVGRLLRMAAVNRYPVGCLFPFELFQTLIAIKQDKKDLNFLKMYASSKHHQDVTENRLLFLLGLPMQALTTKQWHEMAVGLIGMGEEVEGVIVGWPRNEKNGLKLLNHTELKKLDLAKIRNAVAQIYTEGSEVEVKESEEVDEQKIQSFVFKKAREDKKFLEILKNAYAIAEGFYNSNTSSSLQVKTNASDLQLQIEGEGVTSENIIRSIDPVSSDASQETQNYLKRWILEKKEDKKLLTQFLFATTSLICLTAEMKIKINEESSRFSRISFATCFNKITINMEMIKDHALKEGLDVYAFFKECLEEAVLNGQTDFSRG